MKIDVLDKGFVELVASMGSDQTVVDAARVSVSGPGVKLVRKDEKLIKYLATNKHYSPFEHVAFTFRVKAPIFVIRQWFRHRTWAYSEQSARYGEMVDEFYLPEISRYQAQSKDNKQASGDGLDCATQVTLAQTLEVNTKQAYANYEWALKEGLARETARLMLPVNLYSTFYGTVNLRNLAAFLQLRIHPHAQKEIQDYGRALYKVAKEVAPVALEALAGDLDEAFEK